MKMLNKLTYSDSLNDQFDIKWKPKSSIKLIYNSKINILHVLAYEDVYANIIQVLVLVIIVFHKKESIMGFAEKPQSFWNSKEFTTLERIDVRNGKDRTQIFYFW